MTWPDDWIALLLGALLVGTVLSALLALGWWLRYRRLRRSAERLRLVAPHGLACPPQRLEDLPATGSWAPATLGDPLPVDARSWAFEDQPMDWRRSMASLGTQLRDHRVAEVTLVHGTFVGTDPVALLQALDRIPGSGLDLRRRLGPMMKASAEHLLQDASNFPASYAALLQAATGVPTSIFHWSSENGHVARLRAAVRLARYLAARTETRPPHARTLLVGHSHAGQIFALLLQLRDEVAHAPQLVAIAREIGEDGDALMEALAVLRRRRVDVVTMGTPVRYGWTEAAGPQLLHLVNHRGEGPTVPDLPRGLQRMLTTADGDYIQLLGIAGSDLPSADPGTRALEDLLDEPLGPGWAPRAWLEGVRHGRRVPEGGFTWLVDYGDASESGRANLIQTGLGHAIYTRRTTMAFWLERAAERFYP